MSVERSIFKESSHPERNSPDPIQSRKLSGAIIDFDAYRDASFFGQALNEEAFIDTQDVARDTLGIVTGKTRLDTTTERKSPGLAILMSTVLPGAGQVYVHRYITIPIIWGFGYYFVKAWINQNNQYKQYGDLFTASVQADTLHQGNDLYRQYRDFYRDDRDKFAFYIAITYILNIVDAYVGASLYSFDVSDNLGGSAAIRFRFPIR